MRGFFFFEYFENNLRAIAHKYVQIRTKRGVRGDEWIFKTGKIIVKW